MWHLISLIHIFSSRPDAFFPEDRLVADLWLLNSCTVKGPAEDHFRNDVTTARNLGKPVVVAGCVPQGQPKAKYIQVNRRELPYVIKINISCNLCGIDVELSQVFKFFGINCDLLYREVSNTIFPATLLNLLVSRLSQHFQTHCLQQLVQNQLAISNFTFPATFAKSTGILFIVRFLHFLRIVLNWLVLVV